MSNQTIPNDQVTLVNSADEVLGFMDKIEAHRGEAQLHRAISVYLFRKNSTTGVVELLVQQRSSKKIVGAYQWANTVCGNVWPNESYIACAYRRLDFELGITATEDTLSLQELVKFEYQVRCNEEFSEHELDQAFAGWYEGATAANPDEVQETEWVDWDSVQQEFATRQFSRAWAPWFGIMMEHEAVQKSLKKFIESKNA